MSEDAIRKDREKKLSKLKNPYPARVKRTHQIGNALKSFDNLSKNGETLSLVGRIISIRNQGSVLFADLKDESGKIQVVIKKDSVKNYKEIESSLDPSDFLEVSGALFTTKKGEKSIEAKESRIIVKSLRGVPSTWYGLKDVEERFRKRYLDMLLNDETNEKLKTRSKIIHELRNALAKDGFIEVETPMLQPIPGGAKARPFTTHHNALDIDFYLRIAPELYLKRLLAGGWEKIFEIGRVFRNEGMDRDHNPEFTMLELYWAYQDYDGLIKYTEQLLKPFINGRWTTITLSDAFKKYAKKDISKIPEDEIDEILKKEIRPKIKEPTFIVDYPKSISPLAKSKDNDSALTERFQLVVDGMEIVNGFSELNDPTDQRERMEKQEKMYREGDEEASRLDEEFLEMLEYGMPPAAGLGIGIDRLVAIATKTHSIKEIIPFPTLRPKG